MGSYKEERVLSNKNFVKACMAFLGSFLISMIGGLIFAWWELKYHPTNSQLWMVPFGLLLFFTPAIVWISIFISDDVRNSKDANPSNQNTPVTSPPANSARNSKDANPSNQNPPVTSPPANSVGDTERCANELPR